VQIGSAPLATGFGFSLTRNSVDAQCAYYLLRKWIAGDQPFVPPTRSYPHSSFERGTSYWHIATCILGLQLFLAGCGGGGSTSTPAPPTSPFAQDFSLMVPQSATLQQGGAPLLFSIEAILSGQVVSALTISFPNLPQGVMVWPNQPVVFGLNQGTVGCITSAAANMLLITNARSAATGPGGSTMNAPFSRASARNGCTSVSPRTSSGSVVRAQ